MLLYGTDALPEPIACGLRVLRCSTEGSLWLPLAWQEAAIDIRVLRLGGFLRPDSSMVLCSLSLSEHETLTGILDFGFSGRD